MDELANVLQFDPPSARTPSALAQELVRVAIDNPPSVHGWLLICAKEQAGECECGTPLPKWTKGIEPGAATCGRQQAEIVAGVDVQAIFERQKQRGGDDEVPYILARNARSRMQHNAAVDMGCRGGGNHSANEDRASKAR